MADKRILIATLCDECALSVSATAAERGPDQHIAYHGWVSVSLLSTHDTEYRRRPRSRLQLAWSALRGRPAPWQYFVTREELHQYIEALEAAGDAAFPRT